MDCGFDYSLRIILNETGMKWQKTSQYMKTSQIANAWGTLLYQFGAAYLICIQNCLT